MRHASQSQSAYWIREVHIFWPLITHSSPSRVARVLREARSVPEAGSE